MTTANARVENSGSRVIIEVKHLGLDQSSFNDWLTDIGAVKSLAVIYLQLLGTFDYVWKY